jgi:hypothetical protein
MSRIPRPCAASGYTAAPGVIVTDLADELILLDSSSGEMFSLSGSGRVAWAALGEGVAAAAAAVGAAFDVEPERAEADVEALVRELLQAGLIVERQGEGGTP